MWIQLQKIQNGTQFENLSDDEIYSRMLPIVYMSVSYIMMKRCGIDPEKHIPKEEFASIKDFTDNKAVTIMGTAISDIAKMGLREIAKTVDNLQKQEKVKNHTFAKNENEDYANDKEKIEGGLNYGENRVQESGQLQYAESSIREGENSNVKRKTGGNFTTTNK